MSPTIVLAIEPSTADGVARAGGELARALRARIVLVHVRNDPPLFNSGRERERARNRTSRRGRAVLQRARAALPAAVEVDERFELGVAVERLRAIAGEVEAALLVVGSRRRGPVTAALLGSVSRALARRAPCPVMIVADGASGGAPGGAGETAWERAIVAGVDGSSHSSVAARFARELADQLGDRLLIVPTDAAADPPAVTLHAVAAREHARLIVIAAGLGGGRFAPSTFARPARLASWPVIVVPDQAAALDRTGAADARRAA